MEITQHLMKSFGHREELAKQNLTTQLMDPLINHVCLCGFLFMLQQDRWHSGLGPDSFLKTLVKHTTTTSDRDHYYYMQQEVVGCQLSLVASWQHCELQKDCDGDI